MDNTDMAVVNKTSLELAKKARQSTTVRVSRSTHARLQHVAGEVGRPMSHIVDEAVEAYRRNAFFDAFDLAVARLRSDPKAWSEELAERRALEGTRQDGLAPEEWTDADVTPPTAP